MPVASPRRGHPRCAGPGSEHLGETVRQPIFVAAQIPVRHPQADRHGNAQNRDGVVQFRAARAFQMTTIQTGMRGPAVAGHDHLHAHTRVGECGDRSTESEGLVVRMCGHDNDFAAARNVEFRRMCQRIQPNLRGRSVNRQWPGGESGAVTHRGERHRVTPASRPSRSRSRSAWLCRTYIVRSATRLACWAS